LSRQAVAAAVFSVRDFDLGVGEPVSFALERRQSRQQAYYAVVDDGRFVTLADSAAKFHVCRPLVCCPRNTWTFGATRWSREAIP